MYIKKKSYEHFPKGNLKVTFREKSLKVIEFYLWLRHRRRNRVNLQKLIVFTWFQSSVMNNSSSSPAKGAKPKKRTIKGGIDIEDTKEGHGPEALHGKMVSNIYHYWQCVVFYLHNQFLGRCHKRSHIINFVFILSDWEQGSHSDWKTWKTWKNGKAFSSQGKVREFWTDWKSQGKVRENHTKYWKTETNWDKYYLTFLVTFKWTVQHLPKWIKFSVKKTKHQKNTGKMEKNTGKVREFCQSRKVGTLENTGCKIQLPHFRCPFITLEN